MVVVIKVKVIKSQLDRESKVTVLVISELAKKAATVVSVSRMIAILKSENWKEIEGKC